MGRDVTIVFEHHGVHQSQLFVDVDVAVQPSFGVTEFDYQ